MKEFDNYTRNYQKTINNSLNKFGGNQQTFTYSKSFIIRKLLKKNNLIKNISVLDFGCGIGLLHKYLSDKNINIYGIDVSKNSLKIAKKNNPRSKLKYFNGKKIPYSDNKFDLVIVSCVFHHINKKFHKKILKEIKCKLKKNGTLIIFEHNPFNPITRYIFNNNPFDKKARLIFPISFRKNLNELGFNEIKKSYHMFLPLRLNYTYFLEKFFFWFPLASQYWISGKK